MNHTAPRIELAASTRRVLLGLVVIGAVCGVAGSFLAPARIWASWLLVAYYALGLGLGGLCFVAIHYATGSTWSIAIRRVPEALAGTLPFAATLLAIVFIAHPQLYGWTRDEALRAGSDPALAFKRVWLSWPFFAVRAACYCGIWILFASAIRRRSQQQDSDGNPRWTHENFRLSAAFLVLFGITLTLASVDWMMSLEHHWFSTIFGVYNFASLFLSALAAIILVVLWLERAGPLREVLTDAHLHDLGKLLFAFSTFWMYIWFSQYMLVWYTNIPEETSYFVRRQHGGWFAFFSVNVVLNWLLPFAILLARKTKRQRQTLAAVAGLILLGRWVDVYLMIFPGVIGESPTFGIWEVGLTLGGMGAFGLVLEASLKGAPAVPTADPELLESLQYDT